MRIPGGLVYVGDSSTPADSELSLIDRDLNIGTIQKAMIGVKLPAHTPVAYRRLSWGARALYLHWLAGDRDDRDVEPAFVLTYLSGLERRALRLLDGTAEQAEELRVIRAEVHRLASRYAFQEVLARQAEQFLSLIDHLRAGKPGAWKIGGDPRPGQKTYRPLNPALSSVHYGAVSTPPVKKPPVVSPAVARPFSPSQEKEPLPSPTPPPSPGPTSSPAPAPDDDFLDRGQLAKVQAETRAVDRFLDAYMSDDEPEEYTATSVPARPHEDGQGDVEEPSALEPAVAALLAELIERPTWPRDEAKDRARARGLMLDAALVAINEFAVEQCETELVEDEDDLLHVDAEVLAELDLSALPSSEREPRPTQAPETTGHTSGRPRPSASQRPAGAHPPRWVSGVEVVRVHGRSLTGGMFYYGTPEEGEERGEVIDPSLPVETVERGSISVSGESKGYADLPTNARAAFLDWLAGGRRSSSVQEGILFLFLQGLEHRALVDLRRSGDNGERLLQVLDEVRRLAKDYVYARNFHAQTLTFQSALERLVMEGGERPLPPSVRKPLPHRLDTLALELGRFTGHRPITVEWALAWAVHDARIRPEPALRFSDKFHTAFRKHFNNQFPSGMRLPKSLPNLRLIYKPAHPGIPEFIVPTAGAKDVFVHLPALQALQQLTRAAAAECSAPTQASAGTGRETTNTKTSEMGQTVSPTTVERAPVPSPAPTPEPAPTLSEASPAPAPSTVTSDPTAGQPPIRRWSTWKAPGTQVAVGLRVIPGGMLYTGYGIDLPNAGDDFQSASAIDFRLDVKHSVTTPQCAISGHVTGYVDLTPEQRGRYLLWLQDRSQKVAIPLAFPRLFVQGIERRIVEQIRNAGDGRVHISDLLVEELQRLLATFEDSPEFTEYARGLLDLAHTTKGKTEPTLGRPPLYRPSVEEPPFELLRGLGTMVAAKAALPVEWALEWAAHHLRPQDPELFRENARPRLAAAPMPRRMDLVVPDDLPDLVLTYRPGCPGLGEVEVSLPGVKDLTGVAPPASILDRVRGFASVSVRRPNAVPAAAGEPTAPKKRKSSSPSPHPSRSPHPSAWAHLALEVARHSGEVTPDHRIAIMRGTEDLAGIDLAGQRNLAAHALETETERAEEPETYVRVLMALTLRGRERAGDFLLDVLDAGDAPVNPEQVAFLLAVHQGLGLEAVLRLRLSYRGIAPGPSNAGAFDTTWRLQRSTRHRQVPPRRVGDLSNAHTQLLADLSTRPVWDEDDAARLAAWYGLSRAEAVHDINRAAMSLLKTAVLGEEDDTVVVRVEQAEEMTS